MLRGSALALLLLAACTASRSSGSAPDAAGPTCTWIVTVSSPAIDARGNGCTIYQLSAPDRVHLSVDLGQGHTLLVDTDDPIPGDPYGRQQPPLIVDGVYVPCGAGATGRTRINIGPASWTVNADFSDCQQAVTAKLGGTLPLVRD